MSKLVMVLVAAIVTGTAATSHAATLGTDARVQPATQQIEQSAPRQWAGPAKVRYRHLSDTSRGSDLKITNVSTELQLRQPALPTVE
jgi:hypothetical protein